MDLSTWIAIVTLIGSSFAAGFAYLNWVQSTNLSIMECERRIQKIYEGQILEEAEPSFRVEFFEIYLRENIDRTYRIKRSLIPTSKIEGTAVMTVRIDESVVQKLEAENEGESVFTMSKYGIVEGKSIELSWDPNYSIILPEHEFNRNSILVQISFSGEAEIRDGIRHFVSDIRGELMERSDPMEDLL